MTFITEKKFLEATGTEAHQDDLERCNCHRAGEPLHSQCGWDSAANLPVFMAATPEARMQIRREMDKENLP